MGKGEAITGGSILCSGNTTATSRAYTHACTDESSSDNDRIVNFFEKYPRDSLGSFAGGIAHSFNNLLMVIMGNIELALSNPGLSLQVRKYLFAADKAANEAAALTDQILAFSGNGHIIFEETDLNALIKNNLNELTTTHIADHITINLALSPGLPHLHADLNQINQLIRNLINNAMEAIGEYPGKISIATGVCDTDANTTSKNDIYKDAVIFLDVIDTGCGIGQDMLPKVCDPFFSTKYHGRGLGLAAVKGIVLGHKGELKIESSIGKGTKIRIMLPILKSSLVSLRMNG